MAQNIEQDDLLDIKQFEKIRKIGQGGFGAVFIVKNIATGSHYAAKVITDVSDEDKKIEIIREVNIMSRLSHPSIIRFIGFCRNDFNGGHQPVIITEYMPEGSLSNFISPGKLTNTKKLIILYGFASAMSFLFDHHIIHRDLKPENILLDDKYYPKLADFGLSKYANDYEGKNLLNSQNESVKGTVFYLAPEIMENNEYSYESDVYAFAIVAYEIMVESRAYADEKTRINKFKLLDKIQEGYRPKFKINIPEAYQELIEECWSQVPRERPTFKQIVSRLENDEQFRANIDNAEFNNYVKYIKECEIFYNSGKRLLTFDNFNLSQSSTNQVITTLSPDMSSFSIPMPYPLSRADKETIEIFNGAISKFNEHDFQSSAQLFQKAAKLGLPRASYNYAVMLERGFGVEQNKKKAALYFKAAADAGHVEASFNYGALILDSEEGAKEAASRFKFAADVGLVEAKFNYGMMLLNGFGVEKDKKEAMKLLKDAADSGLVEAIKNYGLMLYKTKRNRKEGLIYLKKFEEKVKERK